MQGAEGVRGIGMARPSGRLTAAQPWVPVLALAYPLLIQPLIELPMRVADAGLDLSANTRNAEANPINQLFWLALIAVAVLLFRQDGARVRAMLTRPVAAFVACYLVVAAASILGSPEPGIAVRRLTLQLVVVLVTLVATYLCEDRGRVLRGCAWSFAIAAFVNLPAAFLLEQGRLGGALGIYSNKNILGLAMALAAIVLVHAVRQARSRGERWVFAAAAAAAGVTLLLSESETSILLGVAAPALAWVTVALCRTMRIRLVPAMLMLSLWIGLAALIYGASGGSFERFTTLLFGDPTLSGRTDIWRFVLGAASQHPLRGTGYASFWGAGEESYVAELAPGFISGLNQAHNGYLDVFVETGALGLAMLVAVLAAGLAAADSGFPREKWDQRRMLLAVMAFAIFHNGLESSWFRSFSLVWVVYLILLGLALERQPTASRD